jgi:hypothetical protein
LGIAAIAAACSDEGAACTTDTDCRFGYGCGYALADGCHATGRCEKLIVNGGCDLPAAMCACDGTTTVTSCEAPGFAAQPVARTGACDAGDAAAE